MKLEVKNNWEYLTYTFDGKPIDEKRNGYVRLVTGETVRYKSVETSATYNDMGHSCTMRVFKLIATVMFHQTPIEVELKQLDIEKFLCYGDVLTEVK